MVPSTAQQAHTALSYPVPYATSSRSKHPHVALGAPDLACRQRARACVVHAPSHLRMFSTTRHVVWLGGFSGCRRLAELLLAIGNNLEWTAIVHMHLHTCLPNGLEGHVAERPAADQLIV